MSVWTQAAIVFATVTALDVMWVWYTAAVTRRATLAASGWAAALSTLSGISTVIFVNDPRTLAAAVLGAFVGTGGGMIMARRRDKREES